MTIDVAGRAIPLAFNLAAMDALEQQSGAPLNINETVKSLGDRSKLLDVVCILNACAAEDGEAVSREWLKKHLYPGQLPAIQVAVLGAITEGMRMETETQDPDEEVDVVLEEIKKKEPAAG